MENLLNQLDAGKTLVVTDTSTSVGGKVMKYITEIYKKDNGYIVEGQTVASRFGYSTLGEIENYIKTIKENSLDCSITAR